MGRYRKLSASDLRGVTDKDFKDLVLEAMDAGAVGRKTNGGHLALRVKSKTLFLPMTPGDHRSVRNARSMLRRTLRGDG